MLKELPQLQQNIALYNMSSYIFKDISKPCP